MDAVNITGLNYAYPAGQKALVDVQVTVGRGECVALAGPNGSGKSTLLMHLAGLLPAEQVSIFSTPASGKKNLRRIRRRVGIVFQDSDDQLFMPTVFEDVAFGPLNQDLPADQVRARTLEALSAVGLSDLADRPSHHLSGGEKKLAALATVLSMHPDLLLLDEPTANLDHAARRRLIRALRSLAGNHPVTMVLATHDLEMALELCSRAVMLNAGRVHAAGDLSDLFNDEALLAQCGLERPLSLLVSQLQTELKGPRGPA